MKNKNLLRWQINRLTFGKPRAIGELIAIFGTSKLIRKPDGSHELLGGTDEEQIAAREWCSMYAHEIVFSASPNLSHAFAQ